MPKNKNAVVFGTRGSQLALWQTRWTMRRFQKLIPGAEVREEILKSIGDIEKDKPLATMGAKGIFTKVLDDALLEHRIDLAVHSLKDYPVEMPEGLAMIAMPKRVAPNDAFVSARYASIDDLPKGAVVGTGSLRRIAQIKRHRPDLKCKNIRGNVETRLQKMEQGRYDAVVLAAAGMRRLGMGKRITQVLPYNIMLPAVGQGTLAVVGRKGFSRRWRQLTDERAEIIARAERALLKGLGGGCHTPIGATARLRGDELRLDAIVVHPKDGRWVKDYMRGKVSRPEQLGRDLARRMIDHGAAEILEEEL